MQKLLLQVFDLCVSVECHDTFSADLLRAGYDALLVDNHSGNSDLAYSIHPRSASGEFSLLIAGGETLLAEDDAHLLFLFEKDMTINAQRLRKDLYFLHAGAVRLDGQCAILVAPSGTGKSTLTWALLENGFEYMSDELAPVDVTNMEAKPYPHAVCLKADPPLPYLLPDTTLRTSATLHVPASSIKNVVVKGGSPIAAIFFLTRDSATGPGHFRELEKVETVMRIYTNTLNALAHENAGLDAATKIAGHVTGYELNSSDLEIAIGNIRNVLTGT